MLLCFSVVKKYEVCFNNFFVQDRKVNESMAMILLNSSDLLRVDLKGVNVILPDLVLALEAVLGDQVDEY